MAAILCRPNCVNPSSAGPVYIQDQNSDATVPVSALEGWC